MKSKRNFSRHAFGCPLFNDARVPSVSMQHLIKHSNTECPYLYSVITCKYKSHKNIT